MRHLLTAVFAAGVLMSCGTVSAVIFGDKGNKPIRDPGWPTGAAEVFNADARIAHWVGPPFGGGEWHAEYRGDAEKFNASLKDFAKIDAPKKRLVVHDGVGRSFWLNMNNEPDKKKEAEADWVFVVWQADLWKQLQELPPDFRPTRENKSEEVPAPQIDVYVGGRIRWEDVKVPDALEVDDQRLEAHGFQPSDGVVLEGTVTQLAGGGPLAARVRLEKIESKQGRYEYTPATSVATDEKGRWVIKSAPAGWHRLVVAADGYADRVVDYATFDDQPSWSKHDTSLAKSAKVSGRVTDETGKPISGVTVQLMHVVATTDSQYKTATDLKAETDDAGRFEIDRAPVGKATATVRKSGYTGPGLGVPIGIPASDLALKMSKAAKLVVKVRFADAKSPRGIHGAGRSRRRRSRRKMVRFRRHRRRWHDHLREHPGWKVRRHRASKPGQ